MKKRLLILMTVTGMIILLGGLLTYGLGVHEIIPVPRPDLIVVGTSLIGILLIVSGVCDLFVKKTKEMEISARLSTIPKMWTFMCICRMSPAQDSWATTI